MQRGSRSKEEADVQRGTRRREVEARCKEEPVQKWKQDAKRNEDTEVKKIGHNLQIRPMVVHLCPPLFSVFYHKESL